jgi:hypothetical protein
MKRYLWFVAILLLALVMCFPMLRVRYHWYSMQRAEEAHYEFYQSEKGKTSEYGPAYRSRRDSLDQRIHYHQNALLELGYLQRTEFPLRNVVLTGEVHTAFFDGFKRTALTNGFWMCGTSSNGTSVIVTCPATKTEDWKRFVRAYDTQPQ